MKKMVVILLLVLPVLAGCGKYTAHAWGSSGKLYQAPEMCQAVAACTAAGETSCFYLHDGYTCSPDSPAAKPGGSNGTH